MAAVANKHVQIFEPQFEDKSNSAGGSNNERSDNEVSDGGENDKDSNEGSDGEVEDGGEDEEGVDSDTEAGWAEAMATILRRKTPESKSSILVKNKELEKMKEKGIQEQLERKKQVDKKRAWEMMCREKPHIVKDRETERALQRVATRGVVQLFNAVRNHRKTIDDKVKEVCGSERKKAKFLSSVSKKDFIDVLRKTEGTSEVTSKTEKDPAAATEEEPTWSVLRNDFMMGATMKDWDKDSDREEPDTHSGGGGGSSESD